MKADNRKSSSPASDSKHRRSALCVLEFVCLSVYVVHLAIHGDTHCQVKHGVHGKRCMAREEGLSV